MTKLSPVRVTFKNLPGVKLVAVPLANTGDLNCAGCALCVLAAKQHDERKAKFDACMSDDSPKGNCRNRHYRWVPA